MLEIAGLSVRYGSVHAVREITLNAVPGRITAILGANGAGKSSVIRAIAGLVSYEGAMKLGTRDLKGLAPNRRAALGLSCVLEGRRLFRHLTVEENLEIAWRFGERRANFSILRDAVFTDFPILKQKRSIQAGLLSGGQQQMLIVSSTTVRSPSCLLLDEPSLGLAPVIVQQVFDFIVRTNREFNTTVLMTEQMAAIALRISDYGYVMRQGALVAEGDTEILRQMQADGRLSKAYL